MGPRVYLGNSGRVEELGEYSEGGVSQAGVYHGLCRLMSERGGGVPHTLTHTHTHRAADTLLMLCGGK